ncbi:hypothetical protein B0T11DRAFT_282986 [Plectosphaerella cucumerina]|uniref:BZIP domain-containing protein n=1 Tax=Plectosphaerella cucumerina TaxID=40658 RepID=A0A8K0TBQ4_9PEZI|nr:hypothetical protein B0T11DRAFT_282986 [Plectosphaerella cucumerina]
MSSRSDNTAGEERAELLIDKHSRHRQRNRKAAQKYRIRKISSTQKLATDVATLEVTNSSLKREAACLRREILYLKDIVLQHADCDCSYVQTYIKLAASKLAAEIVGGGIGEQPYRYAPLSGPGSQQRAESSPRGNRVSC